MNAAFQAHWLTEPSFWQGTLLLVLIFGAAATDALANRIPNFLCALGLAGGFFLSYLRGGLYDGEVSLASSGLACAVAGGVFLPFYLAKGLGSGDVKLMASVGALCAQISFVLWALANTALAGVPLALAILAWRGALKSGLRQSLRSLLTWRYASTDESNAGAVARIPYALAICAGVLWTIWLFMDRQRPLPFF